MSSRRPSLHTIQDERPKADLSTSTTPPHRPCVHREGTAEAAASAEEEASSAVVAASVVVAVVSTMAACSRWGGHPRRSSVGALATRPRPIYVLPSLVKLPVSWLRRAWEPRQGETHIADGCSATQRPGAYWVGWGPPLPNLAVELQQWSQDSSTVNLATSWSTHIVT
jgi:hypothetical protein